MASADSETAAPDEPGVPQPGSPRMYAIDGKGRRHRLDAEGVEIDFGDGRKLALVLTAADSDELELEADCSAELGVPMLVLQPGASNVLGVRVEVDGAQHEVSSAAVEPGPLRARFPLLELNVQKELAKEDKAHAPKKRELRRWARAALHDLDAEVTIRLVGEEEGRMLNRDFRGKDAATNVLTFVYGEEGGAASSALPLQGDLVLCVPVVLREAAEQGKTALAHFAHLVVHGLLHLQGYDHEHEAEAVAMEALEKEILASLGFGDPYA